MSFSAIWAEGYSGELGNGDNLPWDHNVSDMTWFRKHTMGKTIVMGFRTWKTLGYKCLPGRLNIILSKEAIFGMKPLTAHNDITQPYWVSDLDFVESTLDSKDAEIMVIGGAKTYHDYAGRITRVYRTVFLENFDHNVSITSNVDDLAIVYYNSFSSPGLLFSIHEVIKEPLIVNVHRK